jgi:uncharacterized protein (DUF2267 family)
MDCPERAPVAANSPHMTSAIADLRDECRTGIAIAIPESGFINSCEGLTMSSTGISAFDSTLQATNTWLNQIMDDLGITNRQTAYHHLRAVLHVLRDRLTVEQAAALGSQLPMLIRGIYFEGWQPAGKPNRIRHSQDFLDLVSSRLTGDEQEPEAITRAVLSVLSRHVSAGEQRHVKQSLPAEIRTLFADEFHTLWF